jgi:hypothetical protein
MGVAKEGWDWKNDSTVLDRGGAFSLKRPPACEKVGHLRCEDSRKAIAAPMGGKIGTCKISLYDMLEAG